MASKKIDLSHTVYELAQEYPEIPQIMAGLGFTEMVKKEALESVGKVMTIPKGAVIKNISMADVIRALQDNGFELTGEMPAGTGSGSGSGESGAAPEKESGTEADRTAQLKALLARLSGGESLESVRADFVKEFAQVDPQEIMNAEQALINEGAPISQVQKVCDVHSALFHGATSAEKAGNTQEKSAPEASAEPGPGKDVNGTAAPADYTDKNAKAAALEAIPGHPLQTLTKENKALTGLLEEYGRSHDAGILSKLRDLSVHYKKKGDLLYPVLNVRYGISGPSQVMWTVDDEIRDEITALAKVSEHDQKWTQRLENVLQRAQEMIYKEENILFPICAVNFTEDEWKGIYRDSKDYAVCFGVEPARWEEAEENPATEAEWEKDSGREGEVVLPGGHLTLAQLRALLNTIPMEITFVDADNINRFFNEGPKVFKRPGMAIDREVFTCHPPKVEPMVRAIIEDFRSGKRDSVPVWLERDGRPMLISYMAVRDASGNYLGTAELIQDMEFAKKHFLK